MNVLSETLNSRQLAYLRRRIPATDSKRFCPFGVPRKDMVVNVCRPDLDLNGSICPIVLGLNPKGEPGLYQSWIYRSTEWHERGFVLRQRLLTRGIRYNETPPSDRISVPYGTEIGGHFLGDHWGWTVSNYRDAVRDLGAPKHLTALQNRDERMPLRWRVRLHWVLDERSSLHATLPMEAIFRADGLAEARFQPTRPWIHDDRRRGIGREFRGNFTVRFKNPWREAFSDIHQYDLAALDACEFNAHNGTWTYLPAMLASEAEGLPSRHWKLVVKAVRERVRTILESKADYVAAKLHDVPECNNVWKDGNLEDRIQEAEAVLQADSIKRLREGWNDIVSGREKCLRLIRDTEQLMAASRAPTCRGELDPLFYEDIDITEITPHALETEAQNRETWKRIRARMDRYLRLVEEIRGRRSEYQARMRRAASLRREKQKMRKALSSAT